MIVSVMGAKGIRQYDLSRYPKIMLIFSALLLPLFLVGVGVGMGRLIQSVPEVRITKSTGFTQSAAADAKPIVPAPATPSSSHDKASLVKLHRQIKLLKQQLTESRQKHQNTQTQVTALQSELQLTRKHLRSVVASTAPTENNTSMSVDPYRLLAQHPMAIDWLKLNHILTATYKTPPSPEHTASPIKLARQKQPRNRSTTTTHSSTWGTTRTFRAKAKLLHHAKPFDRLYRRRAAISRIARKQLGKHYVWGATGPKAFDCSGFTSYVYRKIGFNIPRTSRMQAKYGKRISRKSLRPGDLIFFDTSHSHRGYVNHVGIYIGNNRFIHASSARKRVIITSLNKAFYSQRFKWARRITN